MRFTLNRLLVRTASLSAVATVLMFAVPVVLLLGVGAATSNHHRHGLHRLPPTVSTVTVVRTRIRALTAAHRAPDAPPDSVAALARSAALTVFTTPGGPERLTLPNPTDNGAPLVLLIVGARPGWYQVLLPIRPNDTSGWVRASDIAVRNVPYQITIVQHEHTAVLWNDGRRVRSFPVAVGTPSTPSPNGLFFIETIIDNVGGNQAYGPWAMALSGFSNVYTSFAGGDAEIAMHGTDEDYSVGTSASHGCFRMHDADATTLAHLVTLGTPVYVSP